MLTTIEGYYEKGKIFLKETPPISARTEVIVTFLPEEQKPEHPTKRILGILKGKISTPDDFNEPLDDLKEYM